MKCCLKKKKKKALWIVNTYPSAELKLYNLQLILLLHPLRCIWLIRKCCFKWGRHEGWVRKERKFYGWQKKMLWQRMINFYYTMKWSIKKLLDFKVRFLENEINVFNPFLLCLSEWNARRILKVMGGSLWGSLCLGKLFPLNSESTAKEKVNAHSTNSR